MITVTSELVRRQTCTCLRRLSSAAYARVLCFGHDASWMASVQQHHRIGYRPRLTTLCVTAFALGLAACGGQNASAVAHRPTHEYVARLSGSGEPHGGARRGRGFAVIALHGPAHQVCWRFTHLRGFTDATRASIHGDGKGAFGTLMVALSRSPRLRHQGCVAASAVVLRALAGDPAAYLVDLASVKYPGGAVLGRL